MPVATSQHTTANNHHSHLGAFLEVMKLNLGQMGCFISSRKV
jgi:hypothetical protein